MRASIVVALQVLGFMLSLTSLVLGAIALRESRANARATLASTMRLHAAVTQLRPLNTQRAAAATWNDVTWQGPWEWQGQGQGQAEEADTTCALRCGRACMGGDDGVVSEHCARICTARCGMSFA